MEKVTSRAELKIVQLEPWLEPAWLGLITTGQVFCGLLITSSLSFANCQTK